MNLDEWNRLLADCELFDAVFSRREAAYCFVLSGMFVADEIKRRGHANAPNWEVEMKEGRHLHEALDKLLQLVVERTTGDVTLPITAKILNKRKDGRENAR